VATLDDALRGTREVWSDRRSGQRSSMDGLRIISALPTARLNQSRLQFDKPIYVGTAVRAKMTDLIN
jgi:hypothetical protein